MLSVSRSPLRVSLFGGGSDIEDYYRKHAGEVLSFSINKYVYVAINDKFEDGIRLSYSKTENVQNPFQLEHQICRNLLPIYNVNSGIEIVTIADVPSRGSGLASSSAFTAALMANLNFRNKIKKSKIA
jgi:D-glycero-alpha-D-manno-heptose-7-phosphate kinase